MPRQPQGWGHRHPCSQSHSSSSPAESTRYVTIQQCSPLWLWGAGCKDMVQPAAEQGKHQQTPTRRQSGGVPAQPGFPQASLSHMQHELTGLLLLEGQRGTKQAQGYLPALALLVFSERHLHIGCLPIWLYLQELKEEQRLLPGQRGLEGLPQHCFTTLAAQADACLTCSSGPPPPHAGSTGQAQLSWQLRRLC